MGEIDNFERGKALKQTQELVERVKVCMFCTGLGHVPFETRPMLTMRFDEDGRLWFLSLSESRKNSEVKRDNRVELLYEDLKSSEFMAIHGVAEIIADEQRASEIWTPDVELWIPNGPQDQQLTIIIVTQVFNHHWLAGQSRLIAWQAKEESCPVGTPGAAKGTVAVNV